LILLISSLLTFFTIDCLSRCATWKLKHKC